MSMRLGCFVVAACSAAHAAGGDCTTPGTVLSSTTNVTLRSSPPKEGFLFIVGAPGEKVANAGTGERFTVLDSETVAAALRKDVWVKAANSKGLAGWVYCGTTNKLTNFRIEE